MGRILPCPEAALSPGAREVSAGGANRDPAPPGPCGENRHRGRCMMTPGARSRRVTFPSDRFGVDLFRATGSSGGCTSGAPMSPRRSATGGSAHPTPVSHVRRMLFAAPEMEAVDSYRNRGQEETWQDGRMDSSDGPEPALCASPCRDGGRRGDRGRRGPRGRPRACRRPVRPGSAAFPGDLRGPHGTVHDGHLRKAGGTGRRSRIVRHRGDPACTAGIAEPRPRVNHRNDFPADLTAGTGERLGRGLSRCRDRGRGSVGMRQGRGTQITPGFRLPAG